MTFGFWSQNIFHWTLTIFHRRWRCYLVHKRQGKLRIGSSKMNILNLCDDGSLVCNLRKIGGLITHLLFCSLTYSNNHPLSPWVGYVVSDAFSVASSRDCYTSLPLGQQWMIAGIPPPEHFKHGFVLQLVNGQT